jgi:phage tail sheath protein FI
MGFLHGVEVININTGGKTIETVRTSVIGLVGTAPIGPLNTMQLVTNAKQAATLFGSQLTGFTIPQALDQIFAQGGGPIIVTNVFDSSTMVTAVVDEVNVVASGKFKIAFAPIGGTIVVKHSSGSPTYVAGTDYKVDEFGNVTVLATITEAQSLKVSYSKLNAAGITASVVNGTISSGVYTGMETFNIAQSTFGFAPKIIIAPTYCELSAVATKMIAISESLRAVCLIDGPSGTPSVSSVIGQRGLAGTWGGFKSASKNAMLLWPYLKRYDVATNATVLTPQSPYWAGLLSYNDRTTGFWVSPSNKQIQNIIGVEYPVQAQLNNESSDTNLLNGAGISTLFQAFGTGVRTWGNRSASYPAATTADTFLAVQRVKNILAESVEFAMLDFVDQPITKALIDAIRQSVNNYINALKQRGALVDGFCNYNPDDNPDAQVAAGQLVFQINFAPPTPGERITFNSLLDTTLYSSLNKK